MANFTQEQADAAYAACTIEKQTLNSDTTKGFRFVKFTVEEEEYCLEAAHDVLAMNATGSDVKSYFVDMMMNYINYPGVPGPTTKVVEAKV